MTTQLFRAPTEEQARRAALVALGSGSIIHLARRVPRRGFGGTIGLTEYEVVASAPAAAERAPFAKGAYSFERAEKARDAIGRLRAEVKTELRALKTQMPKPAPAARELDGEVQAIREALDELLALQAPAGKRDQAARAVEILGVEGPAAQRVLKALRTRRASPARDAKVAMKEDAKVAKDAMKEDAREALIDAFADIVQVGPFPLTAKTPAVIVLAGPSGAGKTTTAAKLAARAVIELEASVTIISCDTFRVGAEAQAARYAELIGARFVAPEDADELCAALEAATTDFVIIDTPGQLDELSAEERALLAAPVSGRERHAMLCVPAATRGFDAAAIARAYGEIAPTGIVATKLDETSRPAGVVHAAEATKLPICALCFGPKVPEDISPATTGAIFERLIPRRTRLAIPDGGTRFAIPDGGTRLAIPDGGTSR